MKLGDLPAYTVIAWGERVTRMIWLALIAWTTGFTHGMSKLVRAANGDLHTIRGMLKSLEEGHDTFFAISMIALVFVILWGFFFFHRMALWRAMRKSANDEEAADAKSESEPEQSSGR